MRASMINNYNVSVVHLRMHCKISPPGQKVGFSLSHVMSQDVNRIFCFLLLQIDYFYGEGLVFEFAFLWLWFCFLGVHGQLRLLKRLILKASCLGPLILRVGYIFLEPKLLICCDLQGYIQGSLVSLVTRFEPSFLLVWVLGQLLFMAQCWTSQLGL